MIKYLINSINNQNQIVKSQKIKDCSSTDQFIPSERGDNESEIWKLKK